MQHMYRVSKIAIAMIWLYLVAHCHDPDQVVPYHITSHQITLQLQPNSRSFLAHDTIAIEYERGVTEFYFFINRNLTIKNVSVGHQRLPFTRKDSLVRTPFAGMRRGIDEKSSLYWVPLAPNFNPAFIDIDYYGDGLDSLLDSHALRALAGLAQASAEIQEKILTAEQWYPRLPGAPAEFRLTVVTPGYYERLF